MADTIRMLCERYKVTLDFTGGDIRTDDSGWQHAHYRCTLRMGRRCITTDYRMGIGLTEDPSAERVLDSLLLDADSGSESFEEFCSNFGYDSDSRKAETIYKACALMAQRLPRFLGDAFDAFHSAERE